jgi:hypothetical protein
MLARRLHRWRSRLTAAALPGAVALSVSCDSSRSDVTERTATVGSKEIQVNTQGGGTSRQQQVEDDMLTYASVSDPSFHLLRTLDVVGNIYAQPLATSFPNGIGGTTRAILVATTENLLYAFHAEPPFAPLWAQPVSFGPPADFLNPFTDYARPYTPPRNDGCQNNIGRVGILSTPVVSGGFAYVVAETEVSTTTLAHTIHKVELVTGNVVASRPITASFANVQFSSNIHLQRPGLLEANGVIYTAFGSHCDLDGNDWHGWVMSFEASDLRPLANYCDTCVGLASAGGIWQSGSGLTLDGDGNVVFMSGNGTASFSAATGNSFVRLQTADVRSSQHLTVGSYFTPFDTDLMNAIDADIGISGPVYVEQGNMIYGGGKTGKLYLLDAANLGGFVDGDRQILDAIQGSCNVLATPQPDDCSAGIQPPLNSGPHDPGGYGRIAGTPPYWPRLQRLFVWGTGDYPRYRAIDSRTRSFVRGPGPGASGSNKNFTSNVGGMGGMLSLSTNSLGQAILWATYRPVGAVPTLGQSEVIEGFSSPTQES